MYTCKVEIAKPVEEVYRQFSDPDHLPRWLTGLQKTEPVSGTPGEVGSVTRQTYLEKGRVVELMETITSVEPEDHWAGRIEGQGVDCAIRVDFIDKGDRTTVRMACDIGSQGFVMKLMMPLIRGKIRDRQQGDLVKFKEFVEAR